MKSLIVGVVLTQGAIASACQPQPEVRLADLAAKLPDVVQLSTIGTSRQGRPLHVAWFTSRAAEPQPGDPAPEHRPSLLIIAGASGMHSVGVETALRIAESLPEKHANLLKTAGVYIIPMLNPDSFAFNAQPGRPRTDFGRTIWPHDADHDGRTDEDPAEDLNADGVISMMRIVDPPPGSPWPATLTADSEHPRLMKAPDPAKGESPRYAVFIEGIDNDGDGRFNEDGPGGSLGGGTDLNANMPFKWKEWGDGIGAYPLSEPESLALTRWMYDRPNIAAVVVIGPHDTLVNIPQAGKFDDSGAVPLGIENDDKPFYEEISKLFKDATKMTGASAGEAAGSIHGWSYAHYGVWTFATPVWVRPDLIKAEDGPKEGEDAKPDSPDAKAGEAPKPEIATPPATAESQPAAAAGRGQPGPGGRRRAGASGEPAGGQKEPAKGADPDEVKWLAYSDEKREKAGFIEWQPFDHPQLGKIEIGGFVPGFRNDPPESEHARLAEEQTAFIATLLGKLPRVSLDAPVVEPLGGSLWRVTVRATNSGYLPTMPVIGVKARRAAPTLISLDVPMERVVSGSRTGRFYAIPGSGGSTEQQWVIIGDPGAAVTLKFAPTFGGEQSMTITLQETAR